MGAMGKGWRRRKSMRKTRRAFLITVAAAGCLAAKNGFSFSQAPRKPTHFPTPPEAAETQNPAAEQAKPERQTARRVALQKNEKEFRAGVDRLYQLVSELKQEVEKLPTSEIFSVQMFKRTEEIEKLAKQLKAKARG
jgi:hypothetical protein